MSDEPPGLAAHTDAPEPPPRWDTLLAADDDGLAELRALADLTRWVHWLVDRYALADSLPGCWPQHTAAVEELSALRAAWIAAYDPTALPTDALTWHERLTPTLDRITTHWCRGCTPTEHRERYRSAQAPASGW